MFALQSALCDAIVFFGKVTTRAGRVQVNLSSRVDQALTFATRTAAVDYAKYLIQRQLGNLRKLQDVKVVELGSTIEDYYFSPLANPGKQMAGGWRVVAYVSRPSEQVCREFGVKTKLRSGADRQVLKHYDTCTMFYDYEEGVKFELARLEDFNKFVDQLVAYIVAAKLSDRTVELCIEGRFGELTQAALDKLARARPDNRVVLLDGMRRYFVRLNAPVVVGARVAWTAAGKVSRSEGSAGKWVEGTVLGVDGSTVRVMPDHRLAKDAVFHGMAAAVSFSDLTVVR